jgi:hypothetical protein
LPVGGAFLVEADAGFADCLAEFLEVFLGLAGTFRSPWEYHGQYLGYNLTSFE